MARTVPSRDIIHVNHALIAVHGHTRWWNAAGLPECAATLQREKTEVKRCILEAVTTGQGVLASTAALWQA